MTETLDEALSAKTTAEWLEALQGRVPVAPVNDIASAMDAPFPTETGRHLWVDHPSGRRVGSVGPPIRTAPLRPPGRPGHGADADELLAGLGYGPRRSPRSGPRRSSEANGHARSR